MTASTVRGRVQGRVGVARGLRKGCGGFLSRVSELDFVSRCSVVLDSCSSVSLFGAAPNSLAVMITMICKLQDWYGA